MGVKRFEFPEEWDDATKLSFLQRRVVVWSIQYYQMNVSVVSDAQYDAVARQLEAMMASASPEDCAKSRYWYCMHDFTSATGFDLWSRLNDADREYLGHLADVVVDDYRHGRGIITGKAAKT